MTKLLLFNLQNQSTMYSIFRTGLLVGLVVLFSCQNNQEKSTEKMAAYVAAVQSFPKLLDRHAAIQQGKEWENVQSNYVQFRTELLDGEHEAYWKMARLFIQEARITGEHGHYYPHALQLLDTLLSKGIMDVDLEFRVWTTKASILLSQHEFQQALDAGLSAYELNNYNAEVCGALVDAYIELGQYDQAIQMADQMVAIRPDLRSYARISYLREIFGLKDGAIEAMRMALEAGYPGYEETAWTQLELGNLYAKYGDLVAAKANYEEILSYRPKYPFAMAALADIAFQQENYEEAEQLLINACAIIPEVGFYEQLAHLYKRINKENALDTTLATIKTMLADDVQSGHQMNLEYARFYLDLEEDYNKALTYALEEYQKRPKNKDTNQLMTDIYLKQGNEAAAKPYFETIKKLQSIPAT